MTRPSYLPPPPLRDHQFINFAFMDMVTVAGNAIGYAKPSSVAGGLVGNPDFISRPSAVTAQQAAALSSMSDETFSKLAPILNFVVEDKLVDSKRGLAAFTAYKMSSIMDKTGEMPGQYTMDQAQAYVTYQARLGFHIHWAALAELYNGSSDDQKESIDGLFTHLLDRSLRDLYSVSGPALSLPESFKRDEWRHESDDGMSFVHSAYLDTWLREDIAASQFWVEGRLPDGESTVFIASASTLQEAIGYASAYVMNANTGSGQANAVAMFSSISIDFNREVIAEASLVQPSRYRSTGTKLSWKVVDPDHEMFSAGLFTRELRDAESKLGLRWDRKDWLEQGFAP